MFFVGHAEFGAGFHYFDKVEQMGVIWIWQTISEYMWCNVHHPESQGFSSEIGEVHVDIWNRSYKGSWHPTVQIACLFADLFPGAGWYDVIASTCVKAFEFATPQGDEGLHEVDANCMHISAWNGLAHIEIWE
jgi:hypothetical protein